MNVCIYLCASFCLILGTLGCFNNTYYAVTPNQQFPFKEYYLVSTSISHPKGIKSRTKRNRNEMDKCITVNLNFSKYNYAMCVQKYNLSDHEMVNEDTKFILYKNNSNKTFEGNQLNIKFIKGYIVSKPYSSAFSGYIFNNNLYGKIDMKSKIIYIEPLDNFPYLKLNQTKENAVIYEIPVNNKNKEFESKASTFQYQEFGNFRNKRQAPLVNGNVCSMLIIVDSSFLRIVAKNSIKFAILTVLHSLDLAHSIFRITDFNNDGIPDNIGFTTKYIIVFQSEKVHVNPFPRYRRKPIDGRLYLLDLAKYELLREVCLGAAFSAQPFLLRALGLSYTAVPELPKSTYTSSGGICERPNDVEFGENFNCLVITYRLEHGESVPQVTSDLSLTHELGHSFGSDHDLTKECFGYIMAPNTFNRTFGHNFLFSNCSKAQIFLVLQTKAFCLQKNKAPFCGNGLVEKNEDCDCGLIFNCIKTDSCCLPRNTMGPSCKVNKNQGFQCHPSQGLCCMPNCLYRNISHLGLSCNNFDKSCSCDDLKGHCECGILGTCKKGKCYSNECTRIGMKECQCNDDFERPECVTCCLGPDGKCLPSKVLTEIFTTTREDSIDELSPYSVNIRKSKYSTESYEEYCLGSKCVTLLFRSFNQGSYCLFKGQLGICQPDSICDVRLIRQSIFPKLVTMVQSASCPSHLEMLVIFIQVFVISVK